MRQPSFRAASFNIEIRRFSPSAKRRHGFVDTPCAALLRWILPDAMAQKAGAATLLTFIMVSLLRFEAESAKHIWRERDAKNAKDVPKNIAADAPFCYYTLVRLSTDVNIFAAEY